MFPDDNRQCYGSISFWRLKSERSTNPNGEGAPLQYA